MHTDPSTEGYHFTPPPKGTSPKTGEELEMIRTSCKRRPQAMDVSKTANDGRKQDHKRWMQAGLSKTLPLY